MGTLIRFMDGKNGCWSRVDLTSGDPIWIGVAQTGVMVKISRLGILGAKLYNENNRDRIANTVQALDQEFSQYTTPMGMTSHVLRAFTQAALDCNTAPDLSNRLNRKCKTEREKESGKLITKEMIKRSTQIINEYGKLIEDNPPYILEIRDVSELPYSKEAILGAIILQISLAGEKDSEKVEALKIGARILSYFQENVGPIPFSGAGLSKSEIMRPLDAKHGIGELMDKIAENFDQDKWDLFNKAVDQNQDDIQRVVKVALEIRNDFLEEQKRDKPG